MKAIKQYDEIIKAFESGEKKFDRSEVDNFDLFDAYYKSVHLAGNSIIDFGDVVWEDRIPEIFVAMLNHGVRDFAVSSQQPGIQNIITAFMDCGDGMELMGMTLVRDGLKNIDGTDHMKLAFMLHIIDINEYAE